MERTGAPLPTAGSGVPGVNNNNNGPNGHLFYVGGDLMMRRGMLPIIMLPDGDLRIALHLVPLSHHVSVNLIFNLMSVQAFAA